ncbi:MAG: L,D-transpeptidase family protein [Actinomycetota bacterium]
MIDREQLATALAGLDPRDREILDYSLRRRVPDEDLAELFGGAPGDIARLRAAAVGRLSAELDVQRGADLGHLLRELLEPATWAAVVPPAEPEEAGVADHGPVGVTALPPQRAEPASPSPGVTPVAPTAADGRDAAAEAGETELPESQESPVLDMLVRNGHQKRERSEHAGRWLTLAMLLAVAVLVPVGMFTALTLSDDEKASGSRPATAPGTRTFETQRGSVNQPFPAEDETTYRYPVAYVTKVSNLYAMPRGTDVKVRIARGTDWGTPRALSVVRRDGAWLAVQVPELRNGEVGWIHENQVDRLTSVEWAVHVDLSKRELVVKRDGTPVRRLSVGVGRKGHATPTGRFAVTDKLRVKDPDSPYGCCVLALTGHQTKLPAGWPGGDRLAVHATRDLTGIGRAVSLGCVRTDPRDTRWMMETIPLGAPVFIEA